MEDSINYVTIIGTIKSIRLRHYYKNEEIFEMIVASKRLSGTYDEIPCWLRASQMQEWMRSNQRVIIEGSISSSNSITGGKSKLNVFVEAYMIHNAGDLSVKDDNYVRIENAYICKAPEYRETPSGRQITDLLLAWNFENKKTAYIPAICWGWRAANAKDLKVGTSISLSGRFQSREYQKKMDNGDIEKRIAYEISLRNYNIL